VFFGLDDVDDVGGDVSGGQEGRKRGSGNREVPKSGGGSGELVPGMQVEVTDGPFKTIRGKVLEVRRRHRMPP
jgi:hypothetical protein